MSQTVSKTVSMQFPDGSKREYDAAISGAELAESISKSLAKKAVAYAVDGVVRDLSDPLQHSGSIEILTRDDPRALGLALRPLVEGVLALVAGHGPVRR